MTEEAMENPNETPEMDMAGEEPAEDAVQPAAEPAADDAHMDAGASDAAPEPEAADEPEAVTEADLPADDAEMPSDEPAAADEDQPEPEMEAEAEPAEVEAEVEAEAEEEPEAEAEETQEAAPAAAMPEPTFQPKITFAAVPGDEEDEEEEEDEPEEPVEDVPDDGRAWYVIHCYSGQENKVRHNLEQRIDSMDMKGYIFDVVVPTEEEIEVKEGKRRTVERRVFPGYVLVNLLLTEESWYVVRNTPGVTGFVGMGNDPTPLRPEEVASIVKRMEADAPRIKVTFRPNERVRIVDGPFNDFHGVVDEIDMDRAKVRVLVNFFGRETPVELDFLQVEKA